MALTRDQLNSFYEVLNAVRDSDDLVNRYCQGNTNKSKEEVSKEYNLAQANLNAFLERLIYNETI